MIKLKQEILGIKAGSIGSEYGNVDNLQVYFNHDSIVSSTVPYEDFTWDEPLTEFTVHMNYIKEHPELFEIVDTIN